MKNQKTMAKWLAVVLLLTLIVACYIILSAVLTKSNDSFPGVAGADGNSPTDGNDDDTDPIPPPAVYSEFPREASPTAYGSLAHIGGEGEDEYLATVSISSKRLVFFKSSSSQHDVRQSGIHMAILQGSALVGTTYVCSYEQDLILAKPTKAGLLVVTRDAFKTHLMLYDSSLTLSVSKDCMRFESLRAYQSGGDLRMYATDKENVYALSVSSALDVAISSHTYRLRDAQISEVISSGGDGIFLQTSNGVTVLSFDKTAGFRLTAELLNDKFLQILPSLSDGMQVTMLLTSRADGVSLTRLDNDLSVTSSVLIQGATSGVILKNGDNIELAAAGKTYIYCSHLEPQGNRPLVLPQLADNFEYIPINGAMQQFILRTGNHFYLISKDESIVSTLYEADHSDGKIEVCFDSPSDFVILYSSKTPETFGECDVKLAFITAKRSSQP